MVEKAREGFSDEIRPADNPFINIEKKNLGRTFLGKRRYFSGSTPLTPLFCRLNAVNAAIFLVNNGFCG